MKKLIIVFCLVFPVLTIQARGIQEDMDFTGENARTSYAFGMTVGGDLKQAGLEIDYIAFTEGLKAAMEQGQTIMDRDEALEIVQNAFEKAASRQAAEMQIKEEAFLADNAARSDIHTTESGLQYEVLEEGDGPKPAVSDTVKVHYEGTLINGAVFDSSYDRDQPEEIPLEMVIPGWAEGIQLMNTGSRYRLYIPSSLAYGERGAGQVIPPYSTLVFVVDLLEILSEANEADDDEGYEADISADISEDLSGDFDSED